MTEPNPGPLSPRPLDYQPPVERKQPNVLGMTFLCGLGLAVGAGAVCFTNVFIFLTAVPNALGEGGGARSSSLPKVVGVCYFCLVPFAGWCGYQYFTRRGRGPAVRFFMLGLLIGAGLGLLCEGFCFINA